MATTTTTKTTAQRVRDLTAATWETAYSFSRYGAAGWRSAIRELIRRGFDNREIEAVLRSKFMRWAADACDRGGYTRIPGGYAIACYLDREEPGFFPGGARARRLVAETFGGDR